jgi:hypothetical protein
MLVFRSEQSCAASESVSEIRVFVTRETARENCKSRARAIAPRVTRLAGRRLRQRADHDFASKSAPSRLVDYRNASARVLVQARPHGGAECERQSESAVRGVLVV